MAAAGAQHDRRAPLAREPRLRRSRRPSAAVVLRAVAVFLLATIASPTAAAASSLLAEAARAPPVSHARPWRSALNHGAGAVEGISSSSASGSDALRNPHRNLLHSGSGWFNRLPKCPACKLQSCTNTGILWVGHCRVPGRPPRKHCWRWKGGTASAVPGGGNGDSMFTEPAAEGPVEAVFQTIIGNDTLLIRGVACFDDSDCALPAAGFAAINGSAPATTGGVLTATCIRGVAGDDGKFPDEPGVCLCVYGGSNTPVATDNGTASASGSAAEPAAVSMGGRSSTASRRSLLQGDITDMSPFQQRKLTGEEQESTVSATAQAAVAVPVFVDICVQRPSSAGGRASNDSLGVLVSGVPDRSSATAGPSTTLGLPVADVNGTEDDVGPGFLLPDDFAESVYGAYEYAYEYDYDEEEGQVQASVGVQLEQDTGRSDNATDDFDLTMRVVVDG